MLSKLSGLVSGLLLLATAATASTLSPTKVLRVYGPGGPHQVLEECAELFSERHGVKVVVTKALPHDLDERVGQDGDIYYGGAPCMLEEFDDRNPGVLDMTSVEQLHPRRVGIIVRKGNPLEIQGLECLSREEVRLLDVKLENMRQLHGAQPGDDKNLRKLVYTGRQGVSAWRNRPEIDAWVTYRSWYVKLQDAADFVEIPEEQALRVIPMALTNRTEHRQEAMNFIEFLKSGEAYQIFQRHGWD
jgi:accessory colonization factor AcfC